MTGTAKPLRLGILPARQKLQTRAGGLEYVLSGAGTATIVLLNGAGVTLEGWRALYPGIEQIGRVFAWNRFGVRGSDAPRLAQTGAVVVASLRELLAYAGLTPPYVLVGHSLGGLYANLFARLYPQEVAAVLFLEATHPRDREVLRQHETQLARALTKVFSLPQRLFKANLHSEIDSVDQLAAEIAAAGPFPAIPVTVVTGSSNPPKWLMSPQALQARRAHQQDLARLSPLGRRVIAGGSGHFPQLTEPQLVLQALRDLVERAAGCELANWQPVHSPEHSFMSHYTAQVLWQRAGQDFTGNRYSRRHLIRFDGGVELPASSSPHVVPEPMSDPAAVDPEEAFVASLSSCHLLWFLSIAAKKGFCVDSYTDNAEGVMARNGAGKMAMTQVTLRPRVAFSGDKRPTREEIDHLHHKAHEECFIANSVTTDVRCEPVYAD